MCSLRIVLLIKISTVQSNVDKTSVAARTYIMGGDGDLSRDHI